MLIKRLFKLWPFMAFAICVALITIFIMDGFEVAYRR